MELIAEADRPRDKDYHGRAFMTGILGELAILGLGELTAAELEAVGWANRIGETAH